VDAYLLDNAPNTEVARTYGHPIGTWNVSLIDDFTFLFSPGRSTGTAKFNEDLDRWDMSAALTIDSMFFGASAFNGNVSSWDVSNVRSASFLFTDAIKFAGDLSLWDTSRLQTAFSMFNNAPLFNSDISGWNVSLVRNMDDMFLAASSFNQNISSWNVSSVVDSAGFTDTFSGATAFNQNLCKWGTIIPANTKNDAVARMFQNSGCSNRGTPNLSAQPRGPFCQVCA
jgi:surface protein